MNIADLMLLSEASGFSGGSADFVDEYPELSLDECMASLPVVIMESQIENFDITRNYNDALVEAVANQVRSGSMTESATGELSERAFDSIKTAVSNFFARIKKIIEAIIAKLKVFIDKFRLSGKQLWSKYGNDPDLKKTDKLKDLTYDGYKFASESFDTSKFDTADGPERLIVAAYGGDENLLPRKIKTTFDNASRTVVGPGDTVSEREAREMAANGAEIKGGTMTSKPAKANSDEWKDAANNVIEKISSMTSKERTSKMAEALTSMSDLGEDWKESIRKKLWGEKVTMTYGKDGFELSAVGAILSNPANLDKIRIEYEHLRKSVQDYEKKLKSELESHTSNASKAKEGTIRNSAESTIASYYSKYIVAVQDAYNVITGVKNVRTDFEKAKADQAKAMFGRMISAAKKGSVAAAAKKPDNNDAEVDDELLFELD